MEQKDEFRKKEEEEKIGDLLYVRHLSLNFGMRQLVMNLQIQIHNERGGKLDWFELMYSQKHKCSSRCFTERDLCISVEKAGGTKILLPRDQ